MKSEEKKRPDTLETVKLAIEIMRRIPRSNKITAKELRQQIQAAGIDRDIRTIQRQLEMLAESFDVECDTQSKPYGYRWKKHSKGMALPMMSEQESLLLMLAEKQLQSLLPAKLTKSMESFFTQARANLAPYGDGKADAKAAQEWLGKVRVVSRGQPLLPPEIKPGVFEQVTNALYGNQWLDIEYQGLKDEAPKPRRVMPLGLAQQDQGLYLVCRFEGYDDERNLALHRMHKASAVTLTFKRPKFSLEKYDLDGHFGFGNGIKIKLQFEIAKGAGVHLLEMKLSEDQEVEDLGEYYRIKATVVETARLDWWLKGFGERVRKVSRVTV